MIVAGQTVQLLLGVTDSHGGHIPAGSQGMVIGFKGQTLIVSFDRPQGEHDHHVTAEVEEQRVVRTSVSRTQR